MKLPIALAAFALAAATSAAAAGTDDKKAPPLKPCTIRSSSTGSFFDLSALRLEPAKNKDAKKLGKGEALESWHARGYDYGANFTLNFCGPVVEEVKDVDGLDTALWKNVSAYYEKGGKTYSMGSLNTELVLRGPKLILNYTHGSPCESKHKKRDMIKDDHTRRKSTTISLFCDQLSMDSKSPVKLFFVSSDEDECAYYFEARSAAACAGVEATPQQLGPGGVFGVIILIAGLVYLVGGCVYQRTVMNQRGWKQLPNYSMWSDIFNFFIDMAVILTSSCSRFLPSRRGYGRVSLNNDTRGRGVIAEDENRLIDQLDEEWDD